MVVTRDVELTYPGARRPDRRRTVSSDGLSLAVYEWGDVDAPPVLMAHGGFDFAGTFDGLAARLADGGHALRGLGRPGPRRLGQRAVLYSWGGDVRDALAVLDSIGGEPVTFLGHSKGGGMLMELADACPHRVSRLINLDGLPSNNKWPDVSDRERTRMAQTEIAGWLDHRRTAGQRQRKPGTLDGLARRRARMNPRLELDWLRYLVSVGARHDPDGWRWKIDPALRPGGFGPWRPEWSMQRVPSIGAPFLGVLGLEPEVMGWGTQPDDVTPYLPPGARFVAARRRRPLRAHRAARRHRRASSWTSCRERRPRHVSRGHARIRRLVRGPAELALHTLRVGAGRPLLLPARAGRASPRARARPPGGLARAGLRPRLHRPRRSRPSRPDGGYTAEVADGDADAALAELGPATVVGRGLGAYVALLLSGARADNVQGRHPAGRPGAGRRRHPPVVAARGARSTSARAGPARSVRAGGAVA